MTMQPRLDHRLLDEHAYAIVDRSAQDRLPPGLPLVELVPTGLEDGAHWLPWLLPLREVAPAQQGALFDSVVGAAHRGEAPAIRCLIHCAVDPERLALRLKSRLVLRQPEEGAFLLRYHAPAVWAQMLW